MKCENWGCDPSNSSLGSRDDQHFRGGGLEGHPFCRDGEVYYDPRTGGIGRDGDLCLDRGEKATVPSTVVNQRHFQWVAQHTLTVEERQPDTHDRLFERHVFIFEVVALATRPLDSREHPNAHSGIGRPGHFRSERDFRANDIPRLQRGDIGPGTPDCEEGEQGYRQEPYTHVRDPRT